MKKILIITPRFPLPAAGACEQDRFEGIKQLKKLGFSVRVIAKVFDFQNKAAIFDFACESDIQINLLEYEAKKKRGFAKNFLFYFRKIINPFYWDGAAYEYSHKNTKKFTEKITDEWQPDIVWFDYTYLWPLYGIFQKRKISVITRSINFEPIHFLQEDGYTILNLIKFLPKLMSEIITIRKSNAIFSITPKEEKIYKKLSAKNIANLPLRGLPRILKQKRDINGKGTLNVFFAGSTYSVFHNRKVLEFILKKIAPAMEKKLPGKFIFHILGRKFPPELTEYLNERVVYHNFVEDLDRFLEEMDVALVPSFLGAGMQQKIFEPLCRGIPTITSERGLADYPFKDNEHLLFARNLDNFVARLANMRDLNLRKKLSENSLNFCRKLFSQEVLDAIILKSMRNLHVRD